MLIPPQSMPGWKVKRWRRHCWLHPGPDGRLWAINPEAGYFGVVPGTNRDTNKNAFDMIRRDNAVHQCRGDLRTMSPGGRAARNSRPSLDWKGQPYDPKNGPAAHPNSRFTVAARNIPSILRRAEDPRGVPITALIFGGRRREVAPLVYEARTWQHGVLVGASVASETTAAAVGQAESCAGIPWRCCLSAVTTSQTTGAIGSTWAQNLRARRRSYHVNWFRRRCAGTLSLAGLWRKSARAGVDAGSLHGRRGCHRDADWIAAATAIST